MFHRQKSQDKTREQSAKAEVAAGVSPGPKSVGWRRQTPGPAGAGVGQLLTQDQVEPEVLHPTPTEPLRHVHAQEPGGPGDREVGFRNAFVAGRGTIRGRFGGAFHRTADRVGAVRLARYDSLGR